MKTFLLLMSCLAGALAIWTGSPWYLLPQFTALACWSVVFGLEMYEAFTRKNGDRR